MYVPALAASSSVMKLLDINASDLSSTYGKCSYYNSYLSGCDVAFGVQKLTVHFLLESTIVCLTIRAFRVIYGITKRKGDQQNGNYYKC